MRAQGERLWSGELLLSESHARLHKHVAANQLPLSQGPLMLGPALAMNTKQECFEGPFSEQANKLATRDYREPFVVREEV